MTGATGDLTPDDVQDDFDPGERREVEDPEVQASVTQTQAASAPAQLGKRGTPGWGAERGPTGLAMSDGGYGSEQGLASDDPAYRMEQRPDQPSERQTEPESRDPRIGGDEQSGAEDRF